MRNNEINEGDYSAAAVHVEAAAFYIACLKAGFSEEATEFAEWFLDTFDIDLES